MHLAEGGSVGSQALEKQFESRCDGAFGQLQLANIRLVKNHGACDWKQLCAIGDAP